MAARLGEGGDVTGIVTGAWDFERINRRNARHLKVLAERPGGALRNDAAAKALLRWAAAEREAWLDAVTNDPLLPGRILPSDYLGQQAMVVSGAQRSRRFKARWQAGLWIIPESLEMRVMKRRERRAPKRRGGGG